MNLNEKLIELIKSNLTSLEANAMIDEMTRLKSVEDSYEKLKAEHNALVLTNKENYKNYCEAQDRLNNLSAQVNDLEHRKKTVIDSEAKLAIDQAILKAERSFWNSRLEDQKEMMRTIFRNTEVRKQVLDSKTIPVPVQQGGGYEQVQFHTETHNHTETTEQS